MEIKIGNTARTVRESFGLTQRATAEALGVSYVHLCNVENNKSTPSPQLLQRYHELWGVDLYVLAWCLHGETNKLPKALHRAATSLANAWKARIAEITAQKRKPRGI